MSSITSAFAQVDRRIGYFVCVSGPVLTYDVSQNTSTYNSWNANVTAVTYAANAVLEDMGEIARVSGAIFRKVRLVTQFPAGGAAPSYWIVVPGGEYPNAGTAVSTPYTPALVARLG